MERVLGIGGNFFKAHDIDTLTRWYAEHLGVGAPESYDEPVWRPESGPTVFAPFGEEHWESPHLGPAGWGINFRVRDLDAIVEQLRAAGIGVEVDPERLSERPLRPAPRSRGNAIQLWQESS